MNKIIFLVTFLTLISTRYKSQIGCGTISPLVDSISLINSQAKALPLNNATIQLYFHIIRRSNGNDGNSISPYDAVQAFHGLTSIYSPQNICFVLIGFDYVDETNYYTNFNFSSPQCASLISQNVTSNAIDIYIVPNSSSSIQGIASGGIPGRALIIQKQAMTGNKNIFAHELGHCLGLYHTFEPQFCNENTNGSNCSTCGDLICDTPADNNGSTDGSCNYTGGGGYNPLTNNIMSYYDGCLSQLTDGQGTRMLEVIANTPSLQQRLVVPDVYIGPITFPFNPIGYNRNYLGKNKITATNVIINTASGSNINTQITTIGFISENEIELLPGFSANQGVRFAAILGPTCPTNEISFRSSAPRQITTMSFELDQNTIINSETPLYNEDNNRIDSKPLSEATVNILDKPIKISLVPNPASESVKILISKQLENPTIRLTNTLGTVVFLEKTQAVSDVFELNTLNLQSGMYILTVYDREKSYSEKLVISK